MNSLQQNYKYTQKQIDEIFGKLRNSALYIIAKEPRFSHLTSDNVLVDKIAFSLLNSIYQKEKDGLFVFKEKEKRSDVASSILFLAEKEDKANELREVISSTKESINSSVEGNNVILSCVHVDVLDSPTEAFEEDFDLFSNNILEDVNEVIYAGSEWKIPPHLNRDDLLFLDLILVAEGTNKNKDHFLASELEKGYKTLVGMPMVEEHEITAIKGVFYSSSLVRIKPGKEKGTINFVDKGGRLAVRAGAFIYKRRFPREASVLKSRHEQGLLRYSVELGFKKFSCGVCNKMFPPELSLCEHLIMRNSIDDPSYVRIPMDTFFIGGSYTTNPAEPGAVSLDIKDGKKDDKITKACVNSIGLDDKDSSINTEDVLETKTGGVKMGNTLYEFKSVEELLSCSEVQALIEAQASTLSKDEKEALLAASEELSTENAELKTQLEEINSKVEELSTSLQEAERTIEAMKNEKKVSDTLINLHQKGYKFSSDDEIKAFTDRIKNLDDDNVSFIVDLMAKQIKEDLPDVNQDKDLVDGKNEPDSVKASRGANVNASGSGDSIQAIRNSWKERIENLTA